ncbi:hypothetical protein SISSUDRAFT_1066454 [Sistotremastrum suecicum HHB10207 ss-3]|uniref:Uncharacterized protein n=1 Tax=Sistotremastrum suecicum HHB10207 ss-3 TaxID=1314776 RepID=A0A165YAX7_9AGAM|nr:hypothetical protein SISSUDRAFT_1066454 [Sistotremastrum suecicum HHB10207 ss-3]
MSISLIRRCPSTPKIHMCTSMNPITVTEPTTSQMSATLRISREARLRRRLAFQTIIERIAQDVKRSIDKLESRHPNYQLWHQAPRPRTALKEAMEQLLQCLPSQVSSLPPDVTYEQLDAKVLSLMRNMLRNYMLSKLRAQIRKRHAKANRVRGSTAVAVPLRTIPEEQL